MAYEADYWMFRGAVAATAAACVFMPYAAPILALMSLAVADPAEQHKAAQKWHDETPVDMNGGKEQPAAPVSGGGSDLTYLRGELKRLTQEIGSKEEWQGQSYNTFLSRVQDLDGQLQKLDSTRTACGDTLKCSATVYHALAVLCVAVGAMLTAMIPIAIMAKTIPQAKVWEIQLISWVGRLHKMLMVVFKRHWKLVMKVTALLAVAGVAFTQFTQDLPFIKAMPNKVKPNLMEAGTMWDPSKADFTKPPGSEFDTSRLESGMPEFGF